MATELSFAVSDLQTHAKSSLVVGKYGAFVPFSALRKFYSKHYRIPNLLKAFQSSPVNQQAIFDSYLRVFTILVLIQKAAHIRHFLELDLGDQYLPFQTSDDWPLECKGFFALFWEKQWTFCPLDFRRLKLNNRKLHERHVLPITSKRILKEGGHSRTWLIEVYPEYDHLENNAGLGAAPYTYVLKTCRAKNEQSYINESEAYTFLLQHDDRRYQNKNNEVARHLVKLYGSWRFNGEFNLLLEYADKGSLETFLKEIDPPKTRQHWIEFWRNLVQLVKPLERIHELRSGTTTPSIFQGIHQDITLANILVASNRGRSNYDVTFKLADFGLTSFEEKAVAGGYIESRDRRGTQMYSAPEMARVTRFLQESDLPASPDIDIWSLACIFSESLVWCLRGVQGLRDYLKARNREIALDPALVRAGYGGCFHNGETVLNTVIQMHTDLRDTPCPADSIVNDMIAIIEDMLEQPGTRPTALLIHRKCHKMITRAQPHHCSNTSTQQDPEILYPTIFMTDEERMLSPQLPPQLPPGYSAVIELENSNAPENPDPSILQETQKPESSSSRLLKSRAAKQDCTGKSLHMPEQSSTEHQMHAKRKGKDANDRDLTVHVSQRNSNETSTQDEIREEGSFESTGRKLARSQLTAKVKPKPYITVDQGHSWVLKVKEMKSKKQVTSGSLIPLHGYDYLLGRLDRRDQIFLIDNSKSMLKHWKTVIKVFEVLAYLTKRSDPDKMEIYFTNSNQYAKSKNREELLQVLRQVPVTGECNMKNRLDRVLGAWLAEFEKSDGSSIIRSIVARITCRKPKLGANIYIFTDGVWQDKPQPLCKVEETVKSIVQKLNKKGMAADYVGIQFIQFGSDETGTRRLRTLDRDLGEIGVPEDIVDTEPCDGNVLKMLLGSIDPDWDDDETEDTQHLPSQGSSSTTSNS